MVGTHVRRGPVPGIAFIRASRYDARRHLGSRFAELRESQERLESWLDDRQPARVHHSLIAHVATIRGLVPHFHGDGHLRRTGGCVLPMSRTCGERLRDRFEPEF